MISLEKTCNFNSLSWDEVINVVDYYADKKIERMSIREMKEFIFDVLTENLSYTGHEEVFNAISNDFNDDEIKRIVKQATNKDLSI